MQRGDQVLGAAGKYGKLLGGDVAARIAAAQQNLAGAQQQMGQLSAMGGGAAVGSQSWMDAVLHPQSDFVRHCTCAQCGGDKKLPSPTAYMYCDYCSALVDYDFRKVVSGAAAPEKQVPDAAYAQWINQIGADKRAAKEAGDKARFAELEQQFYDSWITKSPNAVSHRVGDPVYRKAYIDYLVANSVATSFDPRMQSLDEEMKAATVALVYGARRQHDVDADQSGLVLAAARRGHASAADLARAVGRGRSSRNSTRIARPKRFASGWASRPWCRAGCRISRPRPAKRCSSGPGCKASTRTSSRWSTARRGTAASAARSSSRSPARRSASVTSAVTSSTSDQRNGRAGRAAAW